MNIAGVSIKRPIATLIIMVMIGVFGVISLQRLKIDLLPNINFPIAVVFTGYEGAAPEEVEGILTTNLESILATVDSLKTIRSISSEGSSLIILEFGQGTDMDFASLDIREKLDLIRDQLPDGISQPIVLKLNPQMMPIATFGISEKGKTMEELGDWVEGVLKPRLERIEGVASVGIAGGEGEEIKIIVDPFKLAAVGASMDQLVNALRMENINAPGGILSGGKYELLVRSTGQFTDIQEIGEVIVPLSEGRAWRVKDLAVIQKGPSGNKQYSKINGRDGLTLSIQKESGVNTVWLSNKIHDELTEIQESYKSIQLLTIVDQAKFIRQAVNTVGQNAILGGILAVAILWLFLRSFGSAAVISISIPISIASTLIMAFFAGISLNVISLGGIALGVGMMVDNSIVSLENIYRMRQNGLEPDVAAEKGTNEVVGAITASTLTTVCVFLPIVFIQGVTGEIFKQLALTVTFSLLASLVVAITLVPMLSSKLIYKPVSLKNNDMGKRMYTDYLKVLTWSLGNRKTILLLVAVLFFGAIVMSQRIGTEYFPAADEGRIDIEVSMPKGTTFSETQNAIQYVEGIVARLPEVERWWSRIGKDPTELETGSNSDDKANMVIMLKPKNERNRTVAQVGEEIRKQVKSVPGCKTRVYGGGSITGGGMEGGLPLSIEIRGDDLSILKNISQQLTEIVAQVPGTREVRTSLEEGMPELRVALDRERAALYGINAALVAASVHTELQGRVATRYKGEGEQWNVRVMTSRKDIGTMDDMEKILIPSPLGRVVPLREVALLEYERGPVKIQRANQSRMISITGSIQGRSLGKVMGDIRRELKEFSLPDGYFIYYGGEQEQLAEAFEDLKLALILGIGLVYMVLAAQFESLIYPFIIMLMVPSAFAGAFGGLMLANIPLSVPAYLGMVMLAGIVVNNGIVLVDYINTLRKEGMGRKDSILAAGQARLRPILMTTLTTVLGLLPLVFGGGEGSELQRPLAISVVGGLILSTLLTLVAVPVFYTIFDEWRPAKLRE